MARRADTLSPDAPEMQLKQLKENQKQLKQEQKNQRKEAKKRAKELETQERELDEQIDGTNASVVIVTIFIIVIWLGILGLLIKMDVGGFGSNVLKPILQDIPVINNILPSENATETNRNQEAYGGYSSLRDAVDELQRVQAQLEQAQNTNTTYAEQIDTLYAEVQRLKTFEDNQVAFQEIRDRFYEEVVYADNGPGPEEYREYYEEMNPELAESLYKQVVQSVEKSQKYTDYANTYKNMKPEEAAKIFNSMTDNIELAAEILMALDSKTRGEIMGAMDPAIAARITRIMNPKS